VRVIVHDYGLEVNEYEALGKSIPRWKPELCLLCGRPTLQGHGVPLRSVWSGASAKQLHARRLICRGCPGAKAGAKSATFTVLPNVVHPFKRYLLVEVDNVIQQRFREGGLSFTALAAANPSPGPAPSTQQTWCRGFLRAAPLWLPVLIQWLIPRKPTALVRSVSKGSPEGLMAMAVQALSLWQPQPGEQVLVPLWTWGQNPKRRLPALLPPVRRRSRGSFIRGPTSSQAFSSSQC
jgi:hypothetical protein